MTASQPRPHDPADLLRAAIGSDTPAPWAAPTVEVMARHFPELAIEGLIVGDRDLADRVASRHDDDRLSDLVDPVALVPPVRTDAPRGLFRHFATQLGQSEAGEAPLDVAPPRIDGRCARPIDHLAQTGEGRQPEPRAARGDSIQGSQRPPSE